MKGEYNLNCEDCNYYTEEFNIDINDLKPYCVKLRKPIPDDNTTCIEYNDNLNCYNCPNRYETHYAIDDVDHYCKKYQLLIYQQTRSVLYKGDFKRKELINCMR